MKANVGSYDCAVRFVLGCVILMFANHGLGWWAALGAIPILSAATRFCLIYALFRINTARWEDEFERRHGR